MKNLSILLLILFLNCNSQQKIIDKKYMNMEAISQKYHDIKNKYESLIEMNKNSLIYENGIYSLKTLPQKGTQWDSDTETNSLNSKFLLKDGDKSYFIKNEGLSETIFIFENEKLIERVTIDKKRTKIDFIDNLAESTAVRYDVDKSKIYLSHYIQDAADPGKRDIMLEQEYYNDSLVLERNYKKDFKITQEKMLEKLPYNFYNGAIKYLQEQNREKKISVDIFRIKSERIAVLKKDLEEAITSKNDFYREIRFHKMYDANNNPIYEIYIQNHSELWEIKIDGKTNEILYIDLELLNA